MAVASAAPGPALAASVAPAPTPAEAKAIAAEAWLYAYAPLQGYQTFWNQTQNKAFPGYVGGFNRFRHYSRSATPADTDIVTPNNDTPYSWTWLDLRAEPIVLKLPAVKNWGPTTSPTAPWGRCWGFTATAVPRPSTPPSRRAPTARCSTAAASGCSASPPASCHR